MWFGFVSFWTLAFLRSFCESLCFRLSSRVFVVNIHVFLTHILAFCCCCCCGYWCCCCCCCRIEWVAYNEDSGLREVLLLLLLLLQMLLLLLLLMLLLLLLQNRVGGVWRRQRTEGSDVAAAGQRHWRGNRARPSVRQEPGTAHSKSPSRNILVQVVS